MLQQAVESTDAVTPRWLRAGLWLMTGLFFLIAFALSLLALFPASYAVAIFIPQSPIVGVEPLTLSGTIWHGRMLPKPGLVLEWQINTLTSILTGSLRADVGLIGLDSNLTAQIAIHRDSVSLLSSEGTIGWPLVDVLMPGLTIGCTLTARLRNLEILDSPLHDLLRELPTAKGSLQVGQGSCQRHDGKFGVVPVPDLTATVTPKDGGSLGRITMTAAPDVPLADAEITKDARVLIKVYPEGAVRVPGMPSSGITELEVPLAAVVHLP